MSISKLISPRCHEFEGFFNEEDTLTPANRKRGNGPTNTGGKCAGKGHGVVVFVPGETEMRLIADLCDPNNWDDRLDVGSDVGMMDEVKDQVLAII